MSNKTEQIKQLEAEMDRLSTKLYFLQNEEKKLKGQIDFNIKQQERIMTQQKEVFDTWRVLIENKYLEGD